MIDLTLVLAVQPYGNRWAESGLRRGYVWLVARAGLSVYVCVYYCVVYSCVTWGVFISGLP